MRLTIFGATGETGGELVRQGLAQGHQLTCLVRDPAAAKLPAAVTQVKGDARDADSVARVIAGSDAVLSALGSRSLRKNDLLDCASANILAGMKKNGVRRIVVLGAAGAIGDALKYQSPLTRFGFEIVIHAILKYPFLDQEAQEHRLGSERCGVYDRAPAAPDQWPLYRPVPGASRRSSESGEQHRASRRRGFYVEAAQ